MGLSVCPSHLYGNVYKTVCPKEIKETSRKSELELEAEAKQDFRNVYTEYFEAQFT
jgi:hypothetical protein